MARRRLQWQLTTDICLAIGLLTALFLLYDYVGERRFLEKTFEQRIRQNAMWLKRAVANEETAEGKGAVVEEYGKFLAMRHGDRAVVALYDADGKVLAKSVKNDSRLPSVQQVTGAMAQSKTRSWRMSWSGSGGEDGGGVKLSGHVIPLIKSGGEDDFPQVVGALR